MTAVQYAQALLNCTSQTDLDALNPVYLNPNEFDAGTNGGSFIHFDYAQNQVIFYHPLYSPSTPGGTTFSTADLTPEAAYRIAERIASNAPAGHPLESVDAALQALDTGLVLIIFGVAVIAAGLGLDYFFPELIPETFDLTVWLTRIGVASIILGLTVETATAVTGLAALWFEPQPVGPGTTGADGTKCQQYSSIAAGCYVLCIAPDGTTTTSSCPGGVGTGLINIAIGIGAVAAVFVGTYVAYRYVSNRPKPGFGTTPPLRQRYRVPFTQYASAPPPDQYAPPTP